MPRNSDEQILCFPTRLLDPSRHSGVFSDSSLWDEILSSLTKVSRNHAEYDPSLKQLIVYILVVRGDKLLGYQRSHRTSEERLSRKWSLGIGGHVNVDDELALLSSAGRFSVLIQAVHRELEEEIQVIGAPLSGARLVAYINDDFDSVGQVHFGTVWVLHLANQVIKNRKERGIGRMVSLSLDDWLAQSSQLERWSILLLEWIRTGGHQRVYSNRQDS